jgi:hypothetical protein
MNMSPFLRVFLGSAGQGEDSGQNSVSGSDWLLLVYTLQQIFVEFLVFARLAAVFNVSDPFSGHVHGP